MSAIFYLSSFIDPLGLPPSPMVKSSMPLFSPNHRSLRAVAPGTSNWGRRMNPRLSYRSAAVLMSSSTLCGCKVSTMMARCRLLVLPALT